MTEPRRPSPVGRRGLVLLGLFAALALALAALSASTAGLAPREAGLAELGRFLAAALRPALGYEGEPLPGDPSFWARLFAAGRLTVLFACAAMAVAVPAGFALGCAGSFALWRAAPFGARALPTAARACAALLRSVHELLWAVLLLAAFGLVPAAAALALALPAVGVLAKVFAELLDEAPEEADQALRGLGAGRLVALLFGRFPRALPDMAAYASYRFECSLRNAAVLGFFGFPTIGYYIAESAQQLRYRSLWTHLWALVALVLLVELWGARLRRRLVA